MSCLLSAESLYQCSEIRNLLFQFTFGSCSVSDLAAGVVWFCAFGAAVAGRLAVSWMPLQTFKFGVHVLPHRARCLRRLLLLWLHRFCKGSSFIYLACRLCIWLRRLSIFALLMAYIIALGCLAFESLAAGVVGRVVTTAVAADRRFSVVAEILCQMTLATMHAAWAHPAISASVRPTATPLAERCASRPRSVPSSSIFPSMQIATYRRHTGWGSRSRRLTVLISRFGVSSAGDLSASRDLNFEQQCPRPLIPPTLGEAGHSRRA